MSDGNTEMSAENRVDRRSLLGGALAAGAALSACQSGARAETPAASNAAPAIVTNRKGRAVLVGSNNGLAGMKLHYAKLLEGADPLDVAIEVVKVVEADPNDDSVGLGGLPNEDGVVQLDAACMYGPRHKSGGVACIENILHPSEVARLVLERTDHCLLVGKDAYRFARSHGHEHVELLTEASRKKWMEWKENHSTDDDRLPPPPKVPWQGALPRAPRDARVAALSDRMRTRQWGTIHCSAMAKDGAIACTTTTSGLSWKIPGRVGDSPIVGAGLYCDQEAGSAGATGRGEANILSNGAFAIVELMRQGAKPLDAAMEVLRRVTRQTERQARYQPEMLDARGKPSFNLTFYVLGLDGTVAGACLLAPRADAQDRPKFAVSTPEDGPHLRDLEPLHG
ncbi:MAG: isoaspartyl peptidase/L-asparaginase [Planctomycetota bacterium]|nr:isoaspartyl peptidase/L-asparaginase [Planctomycetota bacterium]